MCANSEQIPSSNAVGALDRWSDMPVKIGAQQAVLILVTNNTLLNRAFGLKLLHLRLCELKSQERVTFPRMSN
jgi:hypothetical protein